MAWWNEIGRRAGHVGRRGTFDADLHSEVQFHLESRAEELERDGLSREDAMAAARREFGPRLRVAEDSREAWQFVWLEHAIANLRYAARQCRKRPGFAAMVVATLGLGIGANSAVFSAIDAMVLRPLGFPKAIAWSESISATRRGRLRWRRPRDWPIGID